jgi:hypothetical protein
MTPTEEIDPTKQQSSPRLLRWTIFLILALIVTVLGYWCYKQYDSASRSEAVREIVKNVKPDVKELAIVVEKNYDEYRQYSTRWSVVVFSCILLSAAFSAFAGFVLKLKAFSNASAVKEDLAALLAMLAALLITMSAAGDFQRKWQANRIATSDTEALAYDLLRDPLLAADRENLIKKLKEIAATRNREIVGDKAAVVPDVTPAGTPKSSPSATVSPH